MLSAPFRNAFHANAAGDTPEPVPENTKPPDSVFLHQAFTLYASEQRDPADGTVVLLPSYFCSTRFVWSESGWFFTLSRRQICLFLPLAVTRVPFPALKHIINHICGKVKRNFLIFSGFAETKCRLCGKSEDSGKRKQAFCLMWHSRICVLFDFFHLAFSHTKAIMYRWSDFGVSALKKALYGVICMSKYARLCIQKMSFIRHFDDFMTGFAADFAISISCANGSAPNTRYCVCCKNQKL